MSLERQLRPWPITRPLGLEWRRVVRVRGKMPIEIVAGGGVVGRLIANDFWAKDYRVDTRDAAWRFVAHGFRRRRCVAHRRDGRGTAAVGADGALAEGERAGFRRRHVRLESGQLLEWRQLGVGGSRYLLARLHDGQELLTVRNTGGALRWSGTIDVHEPALAFGPVLPLLALFSTFLVFSSSELGFGVPG